MKAKVLLIAFVALGVMLSMGGALVIGQPANDNDDKSVQINTEVVKRFGVDLDADVTCQFRVVIDPLRQVDPIVEKTTTCDNMLRFASNSDLGLAITKFDRTPNANADSDAVLDALGLSIDFGDQADPLHETKCDFFLGSSVGINGFSEGSVLVNAPANHIWYDPSIDGSQNVTITRPIGAGTFDCRFRLDFFLSAQDVVALAAGAYVFEMEFTTSIL